ncbi:LysR substrate-binding domain-containing protein [Schlegelella sp. S2-27]|uniref:LysR substrate-binding domain-containing protein n=1 Tax=Caldimonas mangrovi TaxID=2944811 RepID=A0ABT0YRR1_9BURK|nr:LysR substrate-binding domain-containing protein [Caldimonas mangrovi]MCM5681411.1 LysR substrate-binding domain-containing protein [Caldimonas mangrovi]
MRLPPMNAVRAFDAVARWGSVRAAAEELSVTPAAVSQQLRVLEAHLGVALTQREGRGLVLTDVGKDWHDDISRHLQAIALAAERLRPGRHIVQITVAQSFAVRWLVPRLPAFMRLHPDIEVRVDANNAVADLTRGPFDLALRMGSGRYRATEATLLFSGDLYALANAEYIRSLLDKRGRPDWHRAQLLHEIGNARWPDWFAALGLRDVDVSRGQFFSHTMMTLQAALEGQGVALAPLAYAERELIDGRLLRVLPCHIDANEAVHLLWPAAGTRRMPAAATVLRDWLMEQARLSRAQLQPFEGPRAGRMADTAGS